MGQLYQIIYSVSTMQYRPTGYHIYNSPVPFLHISADDMPAEIEKAKVLH